MHLIFGFIAIGLFYIIFPIIFKFSWTIIKNKFFNYIFENPAFLTSAFNADLLPNLSKFGVPGGT